MEISTQNNIYFSHKNEIIIEKTQKATEYLPLRKRLTLKCENMDFYKIVRACKCFLFVSFFSLYLRCEMYILK